MKEGPSIRPPGTLLQWLNSKEQKGLRVRIPVVFHASTSGLSGWTKPIIGVPGDKIGKNTIHLHVDDSTMGMGLSMRLESHCKESRTRFPKASGRCFVMLDGHWKKRPMLKYIDNQKSGVLKVSTKRWPFWLRGTATLTREQAKAHRIWVQKRTQLGGPSVRSD
jgi:hypothetical protein